ncbi:MAG: hypothetical protein LUD54_01195, partial [Oscillospiraceae bacterium]|nr:hypothetical protein [Oscillospiraceae bacterium]
SYPAWKAGVLPLNYTRKLENHSMKPATCQVFFCCSGKFFLPMRAVKPGAGDAEAGRRRSFRYVGFCSCGNGIRLLPRRRIKICGKAECARPLRCDFCMALQNFQNPAEARRFGLGLFTKFIHFRNKIHNLLEILWATLYNYRHNCGERDGA